MRKLLVAALLSFVSFAVHAQSCPNPGQTYARLEDIRFSDQFAGATLSARVLAAADLKACNTYGVIVVPSHEPATALPACSASANME